MKREATQKVKFKRLQRRLHLTFWQTVGLLESIWLCAYTNAPGGDIGRLTNEDIAAAIEWDADADELVSALTDCGWLDADEEFRLIVHDWSEHVATHLKGAYRQHKKLFADEIAKQRAKQPAKQDTEQPAKQDASQLHQTRPDQTIPNQTFSAVSAEEAAPPHAEVLKEPTREEILREYHALDSAVPRGSGDRRFLTPLAWLIAAGHPIRPAVVAAVDAVRTVQPQPENPMGYLRATLKRSLGKRRLDYLIAQVPEQMPSEEPLHATG